MSAVDEVVYLLEEAFSGSGISETNESQSLLVNLRSIDEPLWHALPTGGGRTVESIALHVGGCKVMYVEYAFGTRKLQWDDPLVQPWEVGEAPMNETIAWLQGAHRTLIDHVRGLGDADLEKPRLANWGQEMPTRWLLSMLLQHDTYHAGEVNHLRSLLQGNDAWRWADAD